MDLESPHGPTVLVCYILQHGHIPLDSNQIFFSVPFFIQRLDLLGGDFLCEGEGNGREYPAEPWCNRGYKSDFRKIGGIREGLGLMPTGLAFVNMVR